ncbi:type II toxin-antitoxin system VapC family toxin [Candidatus Poriferisodalis sp.]|uniref:type II toxin-antitoxin system VapC family toxin n=1 Tax=Candidatus Poriferisodalis sp. TaxID=3101277 RepID=UPI003B025200
MTSLVLDSGGLSRLAESGRRRQSAELIDFLMQGSTWPPIVPTVVLAESLSGRPQTDAAVNRLLKSCTVVEEVSEPLARRAGVLRAFARRGSAVDALVVATAEPGGTVLTGDIDDLSALADYADNVTVTRV